MICDTLMKISKKIENVGRGKKGQQRTARHRGHGRTGVQQEPGSRIKVSILRGAGVSVKQESLKMNASLCAHGT